MGNGFESAYEVLEVFTGGTEAHKKLYLGLLRRAQILLGSRDAAEDAMQDLYVSLFKSRKNKRIKACSYDNNRNIKTWLYSCMTNLCIDIHRKSSKQRTLSLDDRYANGTTVEDCRGSILLSIIGDAKKWHQLDQLILEEEKELIRQDIEGLPEYLRTTVNLIYFHNLKYREAAEVLSIPVGTVKSRMYAALNKLVDMHIEHDRKFYQSLGEAA